MFFLKVEVDHFVRENTHKLNTLGFGLKCSVQLTCMVAFGSISLSSKLPSWPNNIIKVVIWQGFDRYLVSKVFLTMKVKQHILLSNDNGGAMTCASKFMWMKSFHLRENIMNLLCIKWVRSVTWFRKVEVVHFISEIIHKSNALRFWVKVWWLTHSYCCSWPNVGDLLDSLWSNTLLT